MQLNKYTLLLESGYSEWLEFSNMFQFSKADFPKSCIYACILKPVLNIFQNENVIFYPFVRNSIYISSLASRHCKSYDYYLPLLWQSFILMRPKWTHYTFFNLFVSQEWKYSSWIVFFHSHSGLPRFQESTRESCWSR